MSTSRTPIMGGRIRRIGGGFGWVDHRLVREHHIERCSHGALALYLFLVTVADGDGVSWWSERLSEKPSWVFGQALARSA